MLGKTVWGRKQKSPSYQEKNIQQKQNGWVTNNNNHWADFLWLVNVGHEHAEKPAEREIQKGKKTEKAHDTQSVCMKLQ